MKRKRRVKMPCHKHCWLALTQSDFRKAGAAAMRSWCVLYIADDENSKIRMAVMKQCTDLT